MTETSENLRARLLQTVESDVDLRSDSDSFIVARAGTAYCLRSIRTVAPMLSIVLKGRKRIHLGRETLEAVPGRAAFVAASSCIDVENTPDQECGEYRAALLVFPEAVVGMARALLGEAGAVSALPGVVPPCQVLELGVLASEIGLCIDYHVAVAPSRFQHALIGLLLKLHESGVAASLRPSRPRLADSIAGLLAREPEREWRSIDLEDHLAMSGATLRRQLAAEQTSLRAILAETRLSRALHLLQSSRLPVKTVASRSGYRSVSSFVRRFHERYGVEPSRVANSV